MEESSSFLELRVCCAFRVRICLIGVALWVEDFGCFLHWFVFRAEILWNPPRELYLQVNVPLPSFLKMMTFCTFLLHVGAGAHPKPRYSDDGDGPSLVQICLCFSFISEGLSTLTESTEFLCCTNFLVWISVSPLADVFPIIFVFIESFPLCSSLVSL